MLRLLVGATVSVTLSLPSRGTFHLSLTVLVRYRWQKVFSLRRWSSQIPARFLVSRGTWVLLSKPYTFRLPDFHRLWYDFPDTSTKCKVYNSLARRQSDISSPATPVKQRLPAITLFWFRLMRVRSPLLAQSLLFSLRPATEMFQFTGCPPTTLCVQVAVLQVDCNGLPHSEIPGSKLDCSSPRRIVACHVLHRPSAPRHPPCALCSLIYLFELSRLQIIHASPNLKQPKLLLKVAEADSRLVTMRLCYP